MTRSGLTRESVEERGRTRKAALERLRADLIAKGPSHPSPHPFGPSASEQLGVDRAS